MGEVSSMGGLSKGSWPVFRHMMSIIGELMCWTRMKNLMNLKLYFCIHLNHLHHFHFLIARYAIVLYHDVLCSVDSPIPNWKNLCFITKSYFKNQWSSTLKRIKGHVLICTTYYLEEFYYIWQFCVKIMLSLKLFLISGIFAHSCQHLKFKNMKIFLHAEMRKITIFH